MRKLKQSRHGVFAKNLFPFFVVELLTVGILFFNEKGTATVLAGLGMTLDYGNFAISILVIVTCVNIWLTASANLKHERRRIM